MNKKQFLELLVEELERLEEVEHLSVCLNSERFSKVDAVIAQIDYSRLNEYMKSKEFEKLDISDIPKQSVLTFAIYLSGSEYDECDIMKDWVELQEELEQWGWVGRAIAKYIDLSAINSCHTFAELVGDYSDDE